MGNWLIPRTEEITEQRIANAAYYDCGFATIEEIDIPPRPSEFRTVYHLYVVFAQNRDDLLEYCLEQEIEAKVHYPVPIYRQPALAHLDYKIGDFPVSDRHAKSIISFPCDQHISRDEMDFVIDTVREFYRKPSV